MALPVDHDANRKPAANAVGAEEAEDVFLDYSKAKSGFGLGMMSHCSDLDSLVRMMYCHGLNPAP